MRWILEQIYFTEPNTNKTGSRFLLNGGGTGVWEQSPQRGPGAEPPKAEKKLNFDNTKPL